ncbi:hypothetical protein C8F04DRAFT_1194655 [Mycena alexandri]|uniref:Uncharacterized protein n=1 Tax=Mycena alexandri TaxID=1745969 RepID=A0AAD6S6S6_9AGAR|nr:hypothetical protein C8F04DRAFT_1194655 [Mycena alexandri]
MKASTQEAGALNPTQLLFSNYIVTFTVPRQVSDPIHLNDKDKYEYLVKKALLIVKNPSAKIMVEPKIEDKENEMNISGTDSIPKPKSSGKKTKVPKACDILPANVELNEKISELRERWTCPTAGGPCGIAHCFFTAARPEHFPLSHNHFQSWAAARLKGAAFADLETLPNNALFDAIAAGARAAQSPLLQRRLELREQVAAKNAPAAPQVNIFPAEFAALLRPPVAPAPAPPLAAANAFVPPPSGANILIPYGHIPGADLTVANFCAMFKLDDEIRDRFEANKYKSSSDFQFIEVEELKEMGFMRGEVAQIKGAVGKWSQVA